MRNWKLTLDLVLTVTAAAGCAAFAATADAVALGVVGTSAFVVAVILLGAATAFELRRLPLLIAAHWAIVLGLGAAIDGMSMPMDGKPMLIALVSGLAIYALALRRWRGYEAYWAVHGYEEEGDVVPAPVAASQPEEPVAVKERAPVRERIEPTFD